MTSAVTNGNGTAAHAAPILSPLSKPSSGTQAATVSLVIPVRNEARNIAWVLEQITDDVHEIILVDGDSTDATLITARSYDRTSRSWRRKALVREAHCGPAFSQRPATSS